MITYNILPGTVDVSVTIRIIDSTDGTPETGVVFNTSGIDLEYRREGAASTDITEATLAALTTAHADGGFLHIGNGYYRLDLPDAACATGVPGVLVHGVVTGMVVIGCYIQLEGFVNSVYTRIGAPAGASASADVAAVKADTAAILVDTGTTLDGRIPAALVSGRMDSNVGAMAANTLTAAATAADFGTEIGTAVWATTTRELTALDEDNTTIDLNGTTIGTVTTATNLTNAPTAGDLTATMKTSVQTAAAAALDAENGANFTAIPWNAAWDAEVQSEVQDALDAALAEPGQGSPAANASLATKISFIYKAWRNRTTQTASEYALYADDATTKDQEAAISDNGTTLDRSEVTTGA